MSDDVKKVDLNEKITCACGSTIYRKGLCVHLKSQKHLRACQDQDLKDVADEDMIEELTGEPAPGTGAHIIRYLASIEHKLDEYFGIILELLDDEEDICDPEEEEPELKPEEEKAPEPEKKKKSKKT